MSGNAKTDNRTHGQKRIAERQEAMREFMASKGYLEQIEADLSRPLSQDELPEVKFKTETRLKLLAKILPDLKAVEHSSDPDRPARLELTWLTQSV